MADVETAYDPQRGLFNRLFATAAPLFDTVDDGSGYPPLKQPKLAPFTVRNIFSDFKRHDLGPNFHERNYDGSIRREFVTAPLWGVGTTAPYGHDGRSINLAEVILRHGGEAQASRDAFARLSDAQQSAILDFLELAGDLPARRHGVQSQSGRSRRRRDFRSTVTAASGCRCCSTIRTTRSDSISQRARGRREDVDDCRARHPFDLPSR